ncbi:MAG: flippase [Balneolaceae bacterium]
MKREIGKSIARNFSIMFGSQAITWVSSFLLLLFLPRYLGSEDYGRLYLALSIKMMLGLLIDFGGNFLIPKEVARSAKVGSKILNSYLVLRILLWVISIGIILLFSEVMGYSEHVSLLILILAVGKLFEGGSSAIFAFFQGIERMEYPALGSIVERIFVAMFSIGALLMGADSMMIAIIIAVGALIHLLINLWYSRRFVTINCQFDFKVFKLLHSAMPYFLFSLFSVIYYRVDAVMLSAMVPEEVTGWYGGAYRFFDMVMMLPIVYKSVIFPVFAKLWKSDDGVLEQTMGKSLKLILILGVASSVLIFIFAENIIQFFMGLEEYASSVIVLQIFALSIPIIYVDLILGTAIIGAANGEKGWATVGFFAIFLNIGVNYLLIPYTQASFMNGGVGAAAATFVTELFMLISAIYLLPAHYFETFKISFITKPVIAGALMAGAIWLFGSIGLYWMISAFLGGVIYIAGLFAVKMFDKKEMEIIKSLSSARKIKVMLSIDNAES